MGKTSHSRYARLVAGFAGSAFALLSLLTLQAYETVAVAASVANSPIEYSAQ